MASEIKIFNDNYHFYGRHAEEMIKLTEPIEKDNKSAKLFSANYQVMQVAPLIGFLYGRTAELDKKAQSPDEKIAVTNIMVSQIIPIQEKLEFNYRMIMMLDEAYEPDPKKRLDKALRHAGKEPEDVKRFESYIRGGIDVLYEKLVEGNNDPHDIMDSLQTFAEDCKERFNDEFTKEDILRLSNK